MRTCGTVVLVSVAAGVAVAQPSAAPADATKLAEAVVARADAMFSGRMTFIYVMGKEGAPPAHQVEIRFAFSGPSWVKRIPQTDGTEAAAVCHKGNSLEYIPTRQKDGRVTKLARVRPGLDMRSYGADPPVFAGTIWDPRTKDYLRAHAGRAVVTGHEVVNGQQTSVLELDVPKADLNAAYEGFVPAMIEGSRIRLYVAPHLGYILPRYEYVSKAGEVCFRFDATNIMATPTGLHFPLECVRLLYRTQPATVGIMSYSIRDVSSLNEPIPESEFLVDVPNGTEVIDSRSGKGSSRFIMGTPEEAKAPGLDSLVKPDHASSNFVTYGAAAAAGVAVAGAAIATKRIRRPKGGAL